MLTANSSWRDEAQVFPIHRIGLIVFSALTLAFLLIPREGELVERLLEDGLQERALEVSGVAEGSVVELVERLVTEHDGKLSREKMDELRMLISLAEAPAAVYEVVSSKRLSLSHEAATRFSDALALRSLQVGDPKLASRIYLDLASEQPLDEAQLRRAVTASRYSANPLLGMSFLSEYLRARHLAFSQLPEDLRALMITLSRELNDGNKAFDLLVEELKQSRNVTKRGEVIGQLAQVAAQANRFQDAVPILRRYVEATEAGRLSWRELGKPGRRPHASDRDFLKYAKILASHCEWNLKTDAAFDLYRKLALVGDLEALDRCVTIYPWIQRQDEVTDLLASLYPVEERPGYSLLLARLQAGRAAFAEAEKVLNELLQKDAGNAELWAEAGLVFDGEDRFREAIDAYQRAATLDPAGKAGMQLRAARLYVSLGEFDKAVAAYRAVPDGAHTRKSCEDAAIIARASGDPRAFEVFRRIMITRFRKPRATDYMEMASAWDAEGGMAQSDALLEEGERVCPESDVIVFALVERRVQREEYQEAFALLVKRWEPKDFRYTMELLGVAQELGNFDEAIAHLNLSDPLARDWKPEGRLELARVYEKAGRKEEALQIYQKIPGGEPGAERVSAEIAYADERISDALAHQKRYLGLLDVPDADAWMFLGDLQRAVGSFAESDQAYATALDRLKLQVASDLF